MSGPASAIRHNGYNGAAVGPTGALDSQPFAPSVGAKLEQPRPICPICMRPENPACKWESGEQGVIPGGFGALGLGEGEYIGRFLLPTAFPPQAAQHGLQVGRRGAQLVKVGLGQFQPRPA